MPDTEMLIEQHLKTGQTDKAFELVYKLALLSAKKKEFAKAEALRDRLYEIDSFALSRIIDINEIIETEKSRAILPDDRKLWANLFEGLEPGEANELFLAFRKVAFDSETLILKQGQTNEQLYFITRGQVKLVYSDQDKELLITKLGRGDIFGDETFFSVNVCTETVKTLTEVNVHVLDRDVFARLKTEYRTLEKNLQKVCAAKRSVFNQLRQKRIDRRAFRRINWNVELQLSGNRQAVCQG